MAALGSRDYMISSFVSNSRCDSVFLWLQEVFYWCVVIVCYEMVEKILPRSLSEAIWKNLTLWKRLWLDLPIRPTNKTSKSVMKIKVQSMKPQKHPY